MPKPTDSVVRKALRRTLQNSGYCVLETNTGEEAMDFCKRHNVPIDLFLSDLSLPGLRGPNLARMVTRVRPLTRIIFLTGEREEVNSEAGICPDCWLLVRKPFRPKELARALQKFLGRPPLGPSSAESPTQAGLMEQI